MATAMTMGLGPNDAELEEELRRRQMGLPPREAGLEVGIAGTEQEQITPTMPVTPPVPEQQPQPDPRAMAAASFMQSPAVRERVMNQAGYGPEMDKAALMKAQADAASTRRRANLLQALGGIGAALTRTRQDTTFWDKLRQQADAPVQDIMERRAAQQQTEQLARARRQDARAEQTYEDQRRRAQVTEKRDAAKRDPTSEENQRFQAVLAQTASWLPEDVRNQITLADYEGAGGQLVAASMLARERAQRDADTREFAVANREDQQANQRELAAMRRRGRGSGSGGGAGGGAAGASSLEQAARAYFPSDSATDVANRQLYVDPKNRAFRNRVATEYESATGMFAGRGRPGAATSVSAQTRAAAEKYKRDRAETVSLQQRLNELQALTGEEGDIPGQGAGAAMPSAGYQAMRALGIGERNATQALRIRSARDRLLESLLRKATGAAAPPSEKAEYQSMYQSLLGATDEDLRDVMRTIGRELAAIEQNRRIGLDEATRSYLASTGAPGFGPPPSRGGSSGGAGGKTVTRKQYSPSRNQTRITYSDGSTEVVEGRQ